MAAEAQVLASRRSAEYPPQRHRDHRGGFEFVDEHSLILRALCVSVVKFCAKQSQFSEGQNGC